MYPLFPFSQTFTLIAALLNIISSVTVVSFQKQFEMPPAILKLQGFPLVPHDFQQGSLCLTSVLSMILQLLHY